MRDLIKEFGAKEAPKGADKPSQAKAKAETSIPDQPQGFKSKAAAQASKEYRDAVKAGNTPVITGGSGVFQISSDVKPESAPAVQEAVEPQDPEVPEESVEVKQKPHIDDQAHEAATSPRNDLKEPTQSQKEAGNYKKGRVRFQGLDIAIENPRGSERNGVDPDGNEWSHTMSDHYGYIRKTMGADGDQLDVYIGPKPDSDKVYIVDQVNQQDGGFDEHKIMLGYANQRSAVKSYEANFDDQWKTGSVTEMEMKDFRDWVKNGDTESPMAKPETVADAVIDKSKPALQAEEPIITAEEEPQQVVSEAAPAVALDEPVTAAARARAQATQLRAKKTVA